MADIELVVKIPQCYYEYCKSLTDAIEIQLAVANGTPLPKGHGRIGDLDALRCENTDFDTYNDYCTMFDEIEAAETIIEADKEGEE